MIKKGKFCIICGIKDERVICEHHLIPMSEGGLDIKSNKVDICYNCHRIVHSDKYYVSCLHNIMTNDVLKDFRKPIIIAKAIGIFINNKVID